MKKFFFQKILQKEGWLFNTKISIDKEGKIKEIQKNYQGADYEQLIPIAIPGIPNAHSHAFQYAMAGMTENHPYNSQSDFWSWRKNMYDFALNIDPDDLQNIATMLYSEMLSNGYTHVAEFHYLHHDKNGQPYSSLSEMGERILIAGKNAGIDVTLVPVFYNQGNFNTAFHKKQRRFINKNSHDYFKLIESTLSKCKLYNSNLGVGIHSIRAVKDFMITELNDFNQNKYPFHLHISEQLKEVEDCLNNYSLRPVEWLYSNFEVGENHHLVHATHLNKKEIKLITQNKSNVILCPTTEGNLADGFFKLKEFQENKGNWCLGSDSHIGLSPFEETRLLDYGLRLQTNSRKTFYNNETANASQLVMNKIFFNGMKAMGIERKNYFEKECSLNFIEIDEKRPLIKSSENEDLLNTIFYTGDIRNIKSTYVKGLNRTEINKNIDFSKNYYQTIRKIKEKM